MRCAISRQNEAYPAGAIAWSRQSHIRLFRGETGAPADALSLAAMQTMFDEIAAAPDVFWGVAL